MSSRDDRGARDAGTFVALFGLVLFAVGLLAMMSMVMPTVLGAVTVLGAFLLLLGSQYLLSKLFLPGVGDPPEEDDESPGPEA